MKLNFELFQLGEDGSGCGFTRKVPIGTKQQVLNKLNEEDRQIYNSLEYGGIVFWITKEEQQEDSWNQIVEESEYEEEGTFQEIFPRIMTAIEEERKYLEEDEE